MTQPAGHDDFETPTEENRHARADETDSLTSERILQTIRMSVGEQNFQHWFQKRARVQACDDHLVIYVPNPFILNWLLKRFRTPLNRAAQQLLGPSAQCRLEIDGSLMQGDHQQDDTGRTSESESQESPGEAGGDGAAPSIHSAARLTPRPAVVNDVGGRQSPDNGPANPSVNDLTPLAGRRRFRSFDSLVESDSNGMAVLAARQVASHPGQRYNPLYVFGSTGTGKTHLLEAIYTEIRRTRRNANVMYLTSEAFTNYFTSALSGRTVPSFRQRFRNVDVLLVDNIEFLDNKRATQEEFLHTIVQIIENGGQVVVTSDRHPRMLTKHREELTTRFMSGLVCRIEAPDEELCVRVVQLLAMQLNASFADDALLYVARKCKRSVREIQGALNSLDGHFALTRRKITVNVAREVLGDLARECRRLVRINDVERIICEAFGITASELRSRTRRQAIACPRALAMFLARKCTQSAYREIGLYFGGRDHSTVVAAEKRVQQWIDTGDILRLPSSCTGTTIGEVLEQLEERLMTLAS
ncbi:MAG: chromosomal replication initiator protein DnaA [Planctomycetaceae bacterium]|nr:chromosomal replication initiator protein DnaA [Planctomycetaceae bacterium]